jgi:patatin-like phospholipase/acyl hydrolase
MLGTRHCQEQSTSARLRHFVSHPRSLVWLQGLATLRVLWQLQERTGRRMHELFDLVCGTSTGGILAAALAVRCVSLRECEEIYRCQQSCHLRCFPARQA